MSRSRVGPAGRAGGQRALGREQGGYATLSTRPLHILCFLAPLIILYEVGSALYLTDPSGHAVETIRAHRLLYGFFTAFNVGGLFLPGALLAVILLLWHLLVNDRWRVSFAVLPGMLAESAAWTLPLVVLAQIVATAMPDSPGLASAALAAESALRAPDKATGAALTISIGAGLYEEMLFRLLGIALLHFIASDLLRLRPGVSAAFAVAGSAAAFAIYHLTPGAPIVWPHFVFQFLAGLYFGAIYAWRGFGIVVATHALYDVIALALQ